MPFCDETVSGTINSSEPSESAALRRFVELVISSNAIVLARRLGLYRRQKHIRKDKGLII